MSDAAFRRESAVEYFKELVDGALSHQGLATQELTAYYVVQLLASFLQRGIAQGQEDATPLAVRLARALDSGGVRQRASLKEIGDVSLFVSGFFSDSLNRKLVDVDYYVAIGGSAYNATGRPNRLRRNGVAIVKTAGRGVWFRGPAERCARQRKQILARIGGYRYWGRRCGRR